jgi:hypothetical protein
VWKITILRQKIIFFPIAEGGANIFGVFRVKNHDFTPQKNIYFFQFKHCLIVPNVHLLRDLINNWANLGSLLICHLSQHGHSKCLEMSDNILSVAEGRAIKKVKFAQLFIRSLNKCTFGTIKQCAMYTKHSIFWLNIPSIDIHIAKID